MFNLYFNSVSSLKSIISANERNITGTVPSFYIASLFSEILRGFNMISLLFTIIFPPLNSSLYGESIMLKFLSKCN